MIMNKTFKELFTAIQAEEELKNSTLAFLEKQTHGYAGMSQPVREDSSSLTAARPARRFSGILPLHGSAHIKHRHRMYAAVCTLMLFILFTGHLLYFTPTAQISIDINPSIELCINRFDRVIRVNGFNEDGQALLNALDIKYKNYTEAVNQIINSDSVSSLLSDDELMTITVVSSDGQQSVKILSGVKTCTSEHHNTYCYSATQEEVSGAHAAGLSCGKYRAYLELQLLDPDITPAMVKDMTMKEIRELIDRLSAESGTGTSPHKNQGNGHHGHGHH